MFEYLRVSLQSWKGPTANFGIQQVWTSLNQINHDTSTQKSGREIKKSAYEPLSSVSYSFMLILRRTSNFPQVSFNDLTIGRGPA